MRILALLIFIQSISMYPLEAKSACQKSNVKSELKKDCATTHSNVHCCASKDTKKNNPSNKSCCGDMCKCHHMNHQIPMVTMPSQLTMNMLNAIAYDENDKINNNSLHGVDPINNILQPPRI